MGSNKTISRIDLDWLISKYGGAVPRYTSYPTAPEWKQPYNAALFENAIVRSNKSMQPISLYVHIPFCESQCYYCGCNVVISPRHGIEERYINRLKEEINYISSQVNPEREVLQIALGGGTPTYLSPSQLEDLLKHIRVSFNLVETRHNSSDKHEYSVEIDPRVTSHEHLKVIYDAGFNRLSMGIQDFNPRTQEAINRNQSYEMVSNLVKEARSQGFSSINFDLIYGLPFQTKETFSETISKVLEIKPERIALFNYAHIPSIFPFQRKYIADQDLPSPETKMDIFDMAVARFKEAGYEFIGLDHFALPDDPLAVAQRENSLYRNFQGYTTHAGCDLFGIGLTAISDVAGTYKQNHKKLNDYYASFGADKFLVSSTDDLKRREIIKQIMCNGSLSFSASDYAAELERLKAFADDALIELSIDADLVELKVTDLGRLLVRNIAAVFDSYLGAGHKLFSKSL